ncbi:hypothetical protein B0H19DRAFT_1077404 [Mycena capillaripes]|nr:hypothetical protein B0H19DRAFT_1077404 [Mycena capillaripes]
MREILEQKERESEHKCVKTSKPTWWMPYQGNLDGQPMHELVIGCPEVGMTGDQTQSIGVQKSAKKQDGRCSAKMIRNSKPSAIGCPTEGMMHCVLRRTKERELEHQQAKTGKKTNPADAPPRSKSFGGVQGGGVDLDRYPDLAGLGDVKGGCIIWPDHHAGLNIRLMKCNPGLVLPEAEGAYMRVLREKKRQWQQEEQELKAKNRSRE